MSKMTSDTNKSALLELIAGKNRSNYISSLFGNISQATKSYNDSLNSAGTAMKEYDIWLNSTEAKQQKFKAQFEELSQSVLDSNLVKFTYDSGTGLLGFLTQLINNFGLLSTSVATVSGIFSAKGKGLFTIDNTKNWLGTGTGISLFSNSNKNTDLQLIEEYKKQISELDEAENTLQNRQIIYQDTIAQGSQKLQKSVKVS